MKYTIWLVLLMLLAVSCSRTQVIHLDGSRDYVVTSNDIKGSNNAVVTSSNTNNSEVVKQSETNNQYKNTNGGYTTTDNKITTGVSISSSNSTGDYIITSCCTEGRLYAQTKKINSSYTQDNVKNILLDIYHSNCNKFNSTREFVYLRFLNQAYDSGYLIHYKDTDIKKITINGNLISENFVTCN